MGVRIASLQKKKSQQKTIQCYPGIKKHGGTRVAGRQIYSLINPTRMIKDEDQRS
jgi:hypothetical protein